MIGVWMTPCKNGQCKLSVRRDGINKIVIATQTPLTDAQAEELFWCVGTMQNSGKTLKDLLENLEAKPVEVCGQMFTIKYGHCPTCGKGIDSDTYPHWCGFCGQEVKWE